MKFTEEHKLKMSLAQKGIKHTKETKLKMSLAHKGKKLSEETKTKMSGENNHNWKGGISHEPYCQNWSFKEFKNMIKERDHNKCSNPHCNHISNRLSIHHINYIKKDCEPNNLITLCTSCNTKANTNREWHQSFYKAMNNIRNV